MHKINHRLANHKEFTLYKNHAFLALDLEYGLMQIWNGPVGPETKNASIESQYNFYTSLISKGTYTAKCKLQKLIPQTFVCNFYMIPIKSKNNFELCLDLVCRQGKTGFTMTTALQNIEFAVNFLNI